MRDPYVFMLGFMQHDSDVYASDNSGGGMYDIEYVAETLNTDGTAELITAPIGSKQLHYKGGKWYVEEVRNG